MDRYEFTFVLDHALGDEELDTLYEAGGDDVTPEINRRAGTTLLHFDREAPTLSEALVSARRTVLSAGLRAVAVESNFSVDHHWILRGGNPGGRTTYEHLA